jgi:glutamate---cysteine ligase / carboxylate-amine ligase
VQIGFNASPRASVGVEVELELVDEHSRDLTSAASELLARLGRGHPDGRHPRAKHELLESTIEIVTGVCDGVGQANAELNETLAEVNAVAREAGVRLMCSGTHPFAHWAEQQISPNPRYHRLVEEMQWPARRLQIFGIHVHVGVRSGERAIAVMNALCTYIPHLLALSASSPFWMGQETGLASCRSKIFESLPTTGVPLRLEDWSEFEQFMTTLIAAKALTSIREVWWDIRPHPDFGTVELRICDGVPTLREVAAIAAMSQCLVQWMDDACERGERLYEPAPWVVRQNKWRAARYGVDAWIITDNHGSLRPVREALAELVDTLTPVAARLGCEAELTDALEIAERGPSYMRQRAITADGGTLLDVVDSLVDEMETDQPRW